MSEVSVKEKALKVLSEMPATATYEEMIDQLFFLRKLDIGRQQSQAGKGISQAEAEATFKRWQK